MAPNSELDDKANDWFNENVLGKLRYLQDYSIFPGSSEPLIRDGENIGISIKRPDVRLYSTGVTKIYSILVLGEDLPAVVYTPEEEKKFADEWNKKYGSVEDGQA